MNQAIDPLQVPYKLPVDFKGQTSMNIAINKIKEIRFFLDFKFLYELKNNNNIEAATNKYPKNPLSFKISKW